MESNWWWTDFNYINHRTVWCRCNDMYLYQLMKDGGCHQNASRLKTSLVSNTLKILFHNDMYLFIQCGIQSIGSLKMPYISPLGRRDHFDTNSTYQRRFQWCCNICRRLIFHILFPPLSIARCSLIQLSELGHCGEKAQVSKQHQRGFEPTFPRPSLAFYIWAIVRHDITCDITTCCYIWAVVLHDITCDITTCCYIWAIVLHDITCDITTCCYIWAIVLHDITCDIMTCCYIWAIVLPDITCDIMTCCYIWAIVLHDITCDIMTCCYIFWRIRIKIFYRVFAHFCGKPSTLCQTCQVYPFSGQTTRFLSLLPVLGILISKKTCCIFTCKYRRNLFWLGCSYWVRCLTDRDCSLLGEIKEKFRPTANDTCHTEGLTHWDIC